MLAVEDTRRQGGRPGGHNHDADEARKRKGSQPYTGAMPKFSFSPSDVSNKAARFGPDDDDDDIDEKPARSGRFPLDDADEARKRKGSQPFAGAIAKNSFSPSEQHAGDANLAKVNTPATTDTTIGTKRSGALSVDFLRVFSTGFHCYDCRTPIGSGYDALCRHMKKFHANTVVANMSKLHAEMVAAKERLSRLHHDEPVTTVFSMPEIRLKCIICNCSYQQRYMFNRHIRRS
jgi:hypothetical protein